MKISRTKWNRVSGKVLTYHVHIIENNHEHAKAKAGKIIVETGNTKIVDFSVVHVKVYTSTNDIIKTTLTNLQRL